MPTMRLAILLALGLLIGAGATAAGLWLGTGARPDPVAEPVDDVGGTTTTQPQVDEPMWEEPDETRIESTLIVPGELSVSDDGARLVYELRSIAQPFPIAFGPYPAALPESWMLTTTDGERIEGTTDPPGRPTAGVNGVTPPIRDAVSFDLGQGTSAGDIVALEVTGWRVAVPMDVTFTLPSARGASFTTLDGSTVTLANILEQSNGTIFDFDLDRQPDPWRMTEDSRQFFPINDTFLPADPGWRASTATLGTGFQLTWSGPTAPDEVRIEVHTTEWIPVTGSRPVRPVVVDG